jgi:hypothetical protein
MPVVFVILALFVGAFLGVTRDGSGERRARRRRTSSRSGAQELGEGRR